MWPTQTYTSSEDEKKKKKKKKNREKNACCIIVPIYHKLWDIRFFLALLVSGNKSQSITLKEISTFLYKHWLKKVAVLE